MNTHVMSYLDSHEYTFDMAKEFFEKMKLDEQGYTCKPINITEFRRFHDLYGSCMHEDEGYGYLKDVGATLYGIIHDEDKELVGIISCESIDISTKNNSIIHMTYADFLAIHPDYRKKGLIKYLQRQSWIYTHENNNEGLIMQTAKSTKIDHTVAYKKNLYSVHLKNSTFMNLDRKLLKTSSSHSELRIPTMDELRKLNEKRYDFQIIYNDVQLKAMLNNYICRIDKNGNLFVFVRFVNKGKLADAFTLVLINYYIMNKESFKESFIEIGNEMRKKIHMISILNNDVIDALSGVYYEKNTELSVYILMSSRHARANNSLVNLR